MRRLNLADKVRAMRFYSATAVVCLALSCAPAVRAQILWDKQVDGKTVMCMHSGLFSDLEDCGSKSDWYAYVFIGSITAIEPTARDEKELTIVPSEVFSGNPPAPLTVVTSQAPCLPKMAVGDQWLFYLRQEKGKPIVLDYYGNDSLPVSDAQRQIETLRQLRTIGNFGLLRGRVKHADSSDGALVPGAQVIARRKEDALQLTASTDKDGRYQFEPLPPGEYKITVDPVGSFRADDSEVTVSRGVCWDLTLTRSPRGQIRGHVQHADGSPAAGVGVIVADDDGSGFSTETTNDRGEFSFDSMDAGSYVIGVRFPGAPAWKYASGGGAGVEIPTASLYYPGAQSRSGARVVTLATDEKRGDIDFVIPVP